MTLIAVKAFGGERPISSAQLLQANESQLARNVRLVSGAVAPLKGLTTLRALTNAAATTVYRYGESSDENQYWLEFVGDVDVIRSPIASDSYARVYWTDGTYPKYGPNSTVISGSSYPGGSFRLGIPKPANAPTISGTAPTSAASTETRTYVYTYVSRYGEEGPPSDAATPTTVDSNLSVTIGNMSAAPSGSYDITAKRIYRSSAAGSAAQFQFVQEIAVATASYSDSKNQSQLGETLASEDWIAPPAALKGLKLMANGIAIGFDGTTIYLSEPYLPHAWPNTYTVDYPIVGIGVFQQSAAILTTAYPYILSGVDPGGMSLTRMELKQSCVSKKSIVETGDGVIYASPDGLVSVGSGGVNLITKDLYSRDQWLALQPSSISAFLHDNRYHAFYMAVGGARGGLVFDFSGQGATLTETDVNASAAFVAGYSDAISDTLYLVQSGSIKKFNAGSNLTYLWRSKVFRLERPSPMSVGQVNADTYPVTFRVYADGALKQTISVTNSNPFRMPSGFMSRDWYFEVEGTGVVTEVFLASSVQELKSV